MSNLQIITLFWTGFALIAAAVFGPREKPKPENHVLLLEEVESGETRVGDFIHIYGGKMYREVTGTHREAP